MDVSEIKRRMEEKGLVAEDLARMTGVGLRTIQRVLSSDVKEPHALTMKAISEALLSRQRNPEMDPMMVLNWFTELDIGAQMQVLFELSMKVDADARQKVFEAATNVGKLLDRWKAEDATVKPTDEGGDAKHRKIAEAALEVLPGKLRISPGQKAAS